MITVQWHKNGALLLPLKVTPKGGRDCILPFSAGDAEVKLKVSSPPEDGKANAAVIALLAEVLDVPKRRLNIAQGEKSRQKRLAVSEVSSSEVLALLQSLAQAMQTTVEGSLLLMER